MTGCEIIATAVFTIKTELFEVTGEQGLVPLTTIVYVAASDELIFVSVSVLVFEPEILPPLTKGVDPFLH